jgi:hypothetical protein
MHILQFVLTGADDQEHSMKDDSSKFLNQVGMRYAGMSHECTSLSIARSPTNNCKVLYRSVCSCGVDTTYHVRLHSGRAAVPPHRWNRRNGPVYVTLPMLYRCQRVFGEYLRDAYPNMPIRFDRYWRYNSYRLI